jgi:hypothetical protein
VSLEDAALATSRQVQEIVRYIEQSNPQLFNNLLGSSRATRRRSLRWALRLPR